MSGIITFGIIISIIFCSFLIFLSAVKKIKDSPVVNLLVSTTFGYVIALMAICFVIWGGKPTGVFQRVKDNESKIIGLRKEIRELWVVEKISSANVPEHSHIGMFGRVK